MSKRWRLAVGGVVLAAALALRESSAYAADAFSPGTAWEDTQQYFTAPLRWDSEDWFFFGGTLALVGASHEFDRRIRLHFVTAADGMLKGEDKNSGRDALPSIALILGTGAYAGLIRDSDGYEETWRLLEAGVLSTATGEALSYAAGRERPDATSSPDRWRAGGDSFPSVHATAAFAIGMVFAESGNDEYRWIRRIVGYGIAGATAYIRVRDNVHWLSDTVSGAALGIATARFVLNREGNDTPMSGGTHSAIRFQPVPNGWSVSYSIRTR